MSDVTVEPMESEDHFISFILQEDLRQYVVACICGWKKIAMFPPPPVVEGWPEKPKDAWALALGQRHLDIVVGVESSKEDDSQ